MGWVMSATGKCYYDHFYIPKKVKQTKDNNMKHITIERFYELLLDHSNGHSSVSLWDSTDGCMEEFVGMQWGHGWELKYAGGDYVPIGRIYEEKPLSPLKELDNIINRFVDEMSWDPIHAYKIWKDKYEDQLDKMEVEK